jgi:SNF2 family DNA or RNA helicase
MKHCGREEITGAYSKPVSDFTRQEIIRQSILTQIEFDRVVLDEPHTIQNHQTKLCSAIFILRAKIRWTVTGTALQKNKADLFAYFRFLRALPFYDLSVSKQHFNFSSLKLFFIFK